MRERREQKPKIPQETQKPKIPQGPRNPRERDHRERGKWGHGKNQGRMNE
jgi:hypothetical protein